MEKAVGQLLVSISPLLPSLKRALVALRVPAWVMFGALVMVPTVHADELPPSVAQVLKRHGMATSGLSVYVHVVGDTKPILSYAADTPRSPASVLKLLTSAAALEQLGPAYQWKTEVYGSAPVRAGRLDGDLYLKGFGDPYLVIENFWRLLRAVRLAGLETITGDLVIDQSYFADTPGDPGEFDGQATRAYNVLPRALLVNFQAVQIRLLPQPPNLRVITDPPIKFVSRIRLVDAPCRGRGWSVQVMPDREPTLRLDGSYAIACGDDELFRVVSEAGPYIYGVFQSLWQEQGGRLQGGWREATTPQDATLLHTFQSPPLAEVVRGINKYSNNVMTRQLLLSLGAERFGAPGTIDKGVRAIRDWLQQRNLTFPELVLENGSGLSRAERISARHLGQVLETVYQGPYMSEFVSSLPLSAMDGTLTQRFGGPLTGRMHLKTGSLQGVRSLAGYVLDAAGRQVIVVYLHNDPKANGAGGQAAQRALLDWVYQRSSTPAAAPSTQQ